MQNEGEIRCDEAAAPRTSLPEICSSDDSLRIAARYDVTNTAVPSTPVPPWTIFEFGYVDTGLGSATAILYEINPCVPNPVVICRVASVDNQFCGQCTFPNNTFNFLTNLYFVEVVLNRPAEAPAPQACTLRIF